MVELESSLLSWKFSSWEWLEWLEKVGKRREWVEVWWGVGVGVWLEVGGVWVWEWEWVGGE